MAIAIFAVKVYADVGTSHHQSVARRLEALVADLQRDGINAELKEL